MSYDLQLFRPLPGETVATSILRHQSVIETEEINPGPIVPELETAKLRLAAALIARHPSLEAFPFDYPLLANTENCSESEARRRWRHIELNEDAFGLQIMLFDQEASASLPYWHNGKEAHAAFDALRDCLVVMQQEAGYLIYDPQLDRALDPASPIDLQSAAAHYLAVKQSAERAILGAAPRKPWWRFW